MTAESWPEIESKVVELERKNAELKRKNDIVLKTCKEREYRIRQLSEALAAVNKLSLKDGSYHVWIPGEDNHLESLVCPVVIPAEWLRNLIEQENVELTRALERACEMIVKAIAANKGSTGCRACPLFVPGIACIWFLKQGVNGCAEGLVKYFKEASQ
jgi:hypothetical protein